MISIKNKERIITLLQKHMASLCNTAEERELAELMKDLDDNELVEIHSSVWDNFNLITELPENKSKKILSFILSHQHKTIKRRINLSTYIKAISIAACLLLAVATGIYFYQANNPSTILVTAVRISPTQATNYTRQLILPDGSNVILKAGSKLYYSKEFNKQIREVKLVGEAYFDIKHNPSKLFIVHAGNITTTVLGTAFNISTVNNNIVVTVTRGRVKVNNGKDNIAILNKNEVIQYNIDGTYKETKNSASQESITNWTKQEMNFDHIPLSTIAQTLSKRYSVNINITDNELANRIFVSSFNGTENLSEVLTLLCELMPDISYTLNNDNVVISKNNN